ncbi:MAG: FAD:protein FMN transferase [Polyangiaceae bacterium]
MTSASRSAAIPVSSDDVWDDPDVKKVTLERGAMGTKITITAFSSYAIDEAATRRALDAAFAEIQRLEKLMSTWVATSEVSQINDGAGTTAVKVGPDVEAVIAKSLWIAKESGGVFDITFEAMKGLWRFDQGGVDEVPSDAAIQQARKLIDYRNVLLDPSAHTVKLAKAGVRINLGGIAKGYAVDAAVRVLDAAGLRSFFVQAGGDLFVRGRKPDGSRYRVGIRDPRSDDPNDFFARIEVEDHAFSTAGDYERAFVKDGRRYHHIIDPRTGYPATAARSVTIWAADAFTADAIDDAVFILGAKEGLDLAERTDGVGAVMVDSANQVHISKRLEGLVQQQRAPRDAP